MKDILIFGGQSNMQGQTERLLHAEPVADALEYRWLSDSLVPLKNPCGEDIRADGSAGYAYSDEVWKTWHADNALGSACFGRTSLVPAFCEAYLSNVGRRAPVIAVHAAKGSTDISYWRPMGDAYRVLTAKARGAISAAGETRRRCFVWLQGESDAIASRSCAEYKAGLSEFGHALADELGLDLFGIIRVGRFTMDDRDFEIIRAQDELCREDRLFAMLTDVAAEYCTNPDYAHMMNPEVAGHYSAEGLESLGRLAGASLAKLFN